MLVYQGKHNFARVMTDSIEESTVSQIYTFLNHPALAGCRIVIMPDCHVGTGAVIGFTATMNNYIIPSIVGVDIGCGVLAVNLGPIEINYEALDNFIRTHIPSGNSVHARPALSNSDIDLTISQAGNTNGRTIEDVVGRITTIDLGRARNSLGTLGGGNHFIEVGVDPMDNKWLLIHSGSRKFGLDIAVYHQNKAKDLMRQWLIGDQYKDLEYLPMEHGGWSYIEDMRVAQAFAKVNRDLMVQKLTRDFFQMEPQEEILSVHNYISDDHVIRKGAISAGVGERILIPFNMRDGTIVATGMGNSAWNSSAPHGAGRIMSRGEAKKRLSVSEFQEQMKGIWTSCVSQKTLDEAPMAYKDPGVILDVIEETAKVNFFITPVYNFKAAE